jgi:MEMO1 family protein
MNRKAAKLILAGLLFSNLPAQQARPVRDDVGYCWNTEGMQKLTDYLTGVEEGPMQAGRLVAAISPHDDYLYAGRVYFPLFRTLKTKEAVIFGVTHGAVRKEILDPHEVLILDNFKTWPGPAGPIPVSDLRDTLKAHLDTSVFITSDKAHGLEHSIEALLPFLQHFNPEIKITPIMVTAMPFDKMEALSAGLAETIAGYMAEKRLAAGKDIFFLISSDGTHYGKEFNHTPFGEGHEARAEAIERDRNLIGSCLTGQIDDGKIESLTRVLWGKNLLDSGNSTWCGKYSIPFGLLTVEKIMRLAQNEKISGRLFRFSDTFGEGVLSIRGTGMGTTAPFSLRHWVSFFSIGYDARPSSGASMSK